jgi:hypothetical protein
MSTGSNSPAALQAQIQSIQTDIQSIQNIKNDMYTNLYSNTSLTTDQKQKLQGEIKQLEDTYINLQNTQAQLNGILNANIQNSTAVLGTQQTATDIVNNELDKVTRTLSDLQNDNQQKIRQVEINDYFGQKYQEHTSIMVIIITTLVIVIILTVLKNYGLFFGFDSIYYFLVTIISIYILYIIIKKVYYLYILNNMVYGQYDYSYSGASLNNLGNSGTFTNPFNVPSLELGCIEQQCCTGSSVYQYDSTVGFSRCLPASVNNTPSFSLIPYTLTISDIGTSCSSQLASGKNNKATVIQDPNNARNAIVSLNIDGKVGLPFSLQSGSTGIYVYSGQSSNKYGINNTIQVFKQSGGSKVQMNIMGTNNTNVDTLV